MKSFTLDLLHSDEEVHYRDYRINGHKFAFDQIQYNKGGPHNMERIAVPVISKSDGKLVANLETAVILVECGNIYHYLDNGFAVRLSDTQMVTVANEILKKRAEVRGTGLKTLSGWRESGLPSVEDYLEVGDKVDGEMLDYFFECSSSSYKPRRLAAGRRRNQHRKKHRRRLAPNAPDVQAAGRHMAVRRTVLCGLCGAGSGVPVLTREDDAYAL